MKNFVVLLLIALTIGTSSATFAAKPTRDKKQNGQAIPASVSVAQILKSKIDITVAGGADAPLHIRLLDATGRSLAARTLPQNEEATRVRFDLTSLEDGIYLVQVSDGSSTQVTRFELKTTMPAAAAYQELILL